MIAVRRALAASKASLAGFVPVASDFALSRAVIAAFNEGRASSR